MLRQPMNRAPGRDADLVARAVVADREPRRRGAVAVVVARRGRVRAAEVAGAGVVDRVVPVVVVRDRRAVEPPVVGLQRRVFPREARVRHPDDDPLPREARAQTSGAPIWSGSGRRRRRARARLRQRESGAALSIAGRRRSRDGRFGATETISGRRGELGGERPRSASTSTMLTRKCERTPRLPRAAVRAAAPGSAPPPRAAPRRRNGGARPDRGSPPPRRGPPAPGARRGATGSLRSGTERRIAADPGPGCVPARAQGSRREGRGGAR